MPYLLALDAGTTSARAIVYNERGERISMEARPVHSMYPKPGWVEQDAEQIWSAQLESAWSAIEKARIPPASIAAVGITNQRETTIVWDRQTGKPIAPAIVWQCRRTADACALLAKTHGDFIARKTGLVVDAYFSASKLRWILDQTAGAIEKAWDGQLMFGTVDTWLIWNLTGGAAHVTDSSNASRTMLMNIERGDWDDDLLRLFDIPRAILPRIVYSTGVVGETEAEHFGAALPIAGIAGDQQAALFGQCCFKPGMFKNTYGTGCFGLMHTGSVRHLLRHKMITTRAACLWDSQYAVEGAVFIAGAAVQWLRDKLGIITTAAETEAAANTVRDNGGVYMVPAFVGLGAPYWDSAARGIICGLTGGSTKEHIIRATLESIAYQTRELIDAMESDTGQELSELRVDGGAASNNFLMQFQADILGRRIHRPMDVETTSLGAAFLAGLAVGVWNDVEEMESLWKIDKVFEPRMPETERKRLWEGWQSAIRKCRANAS